MADYQKMYLTLFRAVTAAIESLRVQDYDSAQKKLIQAQQECEEVYLETAESE